jgi:hypothetical protein
MGSMQQDTSLSVDGALTEEEVDFVQQLADAGAAGRVITGLRSRAGLLRLVQLKYVTEQSASLDTVVYCITDAGRVALTKPTEPTRGMDRSASARKPMKHHKPEHFRKRSSQIVANLALWVVVFAAIFAVVILASRLVRYAHIFQP